MFNNSKEVRIEVMDMDKQGGEGYHREQEVSGELWKSGGYPLMWAHARRDRGQNLYCICMDFWHPCPAIRTHPIDKHLHRCLICANVGVTMSTELLETKTNLSGHTVLLDIYPPTCAIHIHAHTLRLEEIIDTKTYI